MPGQQSESSIVCGSLTSKLPRAYKIMFFKVTVESVYSPGQSLRPLRGDWMGATHVCFGTL